VIYRLKVWSNIDLDQSKADVLPVGGAQPHKSETFSVTALQVALGPVERFVDRPRCGAEARYTNTPQSWPCSNGEQWVSGVSANGQ
jgi:hypothetical protein